MEDSMFVSCKPGFILTDQCDKIRIVQQPVKVLNLRFIYSLMTDGWADGLVTAASGDNFYCADLLEASHSYHPLHSYIQVCNAS